MNVIIKFGYPYLPTMLIKWSKKSCSLKLSPATSKRTSMKGFVLPSVKKLEG